MSYSSSDFEKVWFLYKTEGEPKGISINAFCMNQGIPYTQFSDWFRRTRKQVVPVQVDGIPSENETNVEPESNKAPESKKEKKTSVKEEHDAEHSIKVIIQSRNGLQIRKSNITYIELLALVEKLEGLC
jgi:hypothetical protein